MKRLACIALLALSGCAPASASDSQSTDYPHLIKSDHVAFWVWRDQFDDGVSCYRSTQGISCVVLPK